MALVTRCPNCATTFRVTPAHLQAHGGDVRCGNCAHIFNGFATLATVQEPEKTNFLKSKTEGPPERAAETLPQADTPTVALSDQTAPPPASDHQILHREPISDPAARGSPASKPAVGEESMPQTAGANRNSSTSSKATGAGEDEPTPQALRAKRPHPESSALKNDAGEDRARENYAFYEPQSRKVSPAWSIGSLFLLVVLAAQVTYVYRGELAVMVPEARPFLEQYCELLQCTIPPPRQMKWLNIESSMHDMRADVQQAGLLSTPHRQRDPLSQAFHPFIYLHQPS